MKSTYVIRIETVIFMGMSKQDLTRKNASIKHMLAELEIKARDDPLKRDRKLHEKIAELKKKLED